MKVETITRAELAAILSNNGFHSAADEIARGTNPIAATEYMLGQPAHYDDGEGRWVADVPSALRQSRLIVID